MKNGFQKYIAVFCAALILAAAAGTAPFAARALAAQTAAEQQTAQQTTDGSGNVTPPASDNSQKSPGSSDNGSQAGGESSAGSGAGSSSGGGSGVSEAPGGSSAESDLITVTFNLNGGTGMKTTARLEKGTSVSQLKTPTKTGYRFTGWSQGGVILPDSKILDSDTTLTANWRKEQSDSESTASVDTRQSQVDAAASAAREAISEPGVLSSEDWNSILSASSAQSGASSSDASSQPASSAAPASGGFSTLLAAGIALILLGIAGVIAFIYLQFIRKPPRGGPRGGSGGGSRGDRDDTLTFTDVSSYSSGKKPDDASAVLYPQTKPGRQAGPAPQKHEARLQRSRAAAPAGAAGFDWAAFFENESPR